MGIETIEDRTEKWEKRLQEIGDRNGNRDCKRQDREIGIETELQEEKVRKSGRVEVFN